MKYSFVIPVHNEEKNIGYLLEYIICNFRDSEIIVVDAGSTDKTMDTLKMYNDIKIEETFYTQDGYMRSIMIGVKKAANDYIFCIDGDGQYLPDEEHLQKDEIVSGRKFLREDPFIRIVVSSIGNWLSSIIFSSKINDKNCGYKVFHKDMIPLLEEVRYFKYSPWAEFILRAERHGIKIKEIPVVHYKRLHGKSRLMNSILKMMISNGIAGIRLWLEFRRNRK